VIVTDNPQRAAPAANVIALMRDWEPVPRGPTTGLATDPKDERSTREVGGNLG
jgi:ABC-type phosphate transport system ATPase subunit